MKTKLIIILCLITFNAFSQDWMPFQEGQKSYYTYESNGDILVDDFKILASNTEGIQTHYTFHEIYGLEGEISEENQQELHMWFFQSERFNFIDAVLRNDSIEFNFCFEWDQEYISTLFKPFSSIGESWTSNDYIITCDTIIETNFLGITDSVKIFSYENSSGDNGQIELSKHHGFVNFCWFFEDTPTYSLIGLHEADFSYGFSAPKLEDFFTYMPEDIMFKRYYSESYDISQPTIARGYKDSIKEVYYSEDTIIYNIHRWTRNESEIHESDYSDYHVSGVEGRFINNELGWIGMTNIEDYPDIFHTKPLALEIQGNDTIVIMSIRKNLCEYYDNSIQLIPDASTDITYKTGFGETLRIVASSGGVAEIELIGGIIDGNEWGTQLTIGIEEFEESNLNIFPNPCKNRIEINEIAGSFKYSIYNSNGQLINTGASQEFINTEDLKSGIYILKLHAEGREYLTQIVKH
jgi:hypothetical protein